MGLPNPPPPGAPIFLCVSADGLTKSRVLLVAGGAPVTIGLDTGTLLEWSTPAVLRIEGLCAWGSNCGAAAGVLGLSRNISTARAEKNPADGEPIGGGMSTFGPGSCLTGG